MMLLDYPAPAAINGEGLRVEVEVGLGLAPDAVQVTARSGRVIVSVPDGSRKATVDAIVAAHTGALTADQQAQLVLTGEARTALQELRALRQLGRNSFIALPAADRDRMLYDALVNVTRILVYAQRDLG